MLNLLTQRAATVVGPQVVTQALDGATVPTIPVQSVANVRGFVSFQRINGGSCKKIARHNGWLSAVGLNKMHS